MGVPVRRLYCFLTEYSPLPPCGWKCRKQDLVRASLPVTQEDQSTPSPSSLGQSISQPGAGPFKLTFDLHDLVRVLDHLILGLIPEGVCPGLDQVQDLVPNINFHLPLQSKKKVGKAAGDSRCLRSQREEAACKTKCPE